MRLQDLRGAALTRSKPLNLRRGGIAQAPDAAQVGERLLLSYAAELARRRRARGLRLNQKPSR